MSTTRVPGGGAPILCALILALGAGCADSGAGPAGPQRVLRDFEPAPPVLSRLTAEQYGHAVRDLLGEAVVVPRDLEPDVPIAGFVAVGSALTPVSPRGVEQYEAAAFDLAEQALETAEGRAALVPCEPEAVVDAACAERFVEVVGRRAFRRALDADEVGRYAALATGAAEVLGDFHEGLVYALAGLLQSPSFLFRVELGEPDPVRPGGRRYTSVEMASRMSFLLWNRGPDEELLAAGERGELVTDAGIAAQAQRLIRDARSRRAVRAFFDDWLGLYELLRLNKDPGVFVHFSPEVGPAAREETLRSLEYLVYELDADYRAAFLTRGTFVDRRLAAIYDVRAPAREGFGRVTFPDDHPRRGLLGQLSFLGLRSHPTSTSATLRGKFIRQTVLCFDVPPPPVNVNTAIPEPTADAVTLRDRVQIHLTAPPCASCHLQMDPIGLGFEQFDGLGRFRRTEDGATIDPSGDLDGVAFADAAELAEVIAAHDRLGPCLVRNVYRYATRHLETEGEAAAIDALSAAFEAEGHRVLPLLGEVVLSPGFREVAPVDAGEGS